MIISEIIKIMIILLVFCFSLAAFLLFSDFRVFPAGVEGKFKFLCAHGDFCKSKLNAKFKNYFMVMKGFEGNVQIENS